MADVEQDGDVDDEADDVRWTDEEIVVEEEDEEDDAAGRGGEAARMGAEVDAVPDAGAGAPGAIPPPPPPDELENDINIEDDMDGALEGESRLHARGSCIAHNMFCSDRFARSDIWCSPERKHRRVRCDAHAHPCSPHAQAILMTLILDITIALGIWLPFTIGKSTALLSVSICSSTVYRWLTRRCYS